MFNDKFYLTQAVLNGNKTQTRRIVKDNVSFGNWEETLKHAPYQIGETLCVAMSYENIYYRIKDTWEYAEEYRQKKEHLAGWKNKMFTDTSMPFGKIRITNVRVERLQDISDEDCLKEGVKFVGKLKADGVNDYFFNVLPTPKHPNSNIVGLFNSPRVAYAELLDRVSGKGTWKANPFVWVYDFELVK